MSAERGWIGDPQLLTGTQYEHDGGVDDEDVRV
jgi:hypothetical protein